MEQESFQSEEIGQILNENFVCIKVDREERPDVDKVYMTFVQVGSWTWRKLGYFQNICEGFLIYLILFHCRQPAAEVVGQ